jgi:hypothetical protein
MEVAGVEAVGDLPVGGVERGGLFDNHFRLPVLAFAEVVMPDAPLRVGEVERRPVVVPERTPYRIVVGRASVLS